MNRLLVFVRQIGISWMKINPIWTIPWNKLKIASSLYKGLENNHSTDKRMGGRKTQNKFIRKPSTQSWCYCLVFDTIFTFHLICIKHLMIFVWKEVRIFLNFLFSFPVYWNIIKIYSDQKYRQIINFLFYIRYIKLWF